MIFFFSAKKNNNSNVDRVQIKVELVYVYVCVQCALIHLLFPYFHGRFESKRRKMMSNNLIIIFFRIKILTNIFRLNVYSLINIYLYLNSQHIYIR